MMITIPLKKLFLSHCHGDAAEVQELATELRLRGVVPWVDKQGGFTVGDDCPAEARRAIRKDCFGLLLYATERVFNRPFIRDVEIDEARSVRESDPRFILFAVPRGIGFGELKELSLREFGVDLSKFHAEPILDEVGLQAACAHVASPVLEKVLQRVATTGKYSLALQYSTREIFPDESDDVLRIDATALFRERIDHYDAWSRLIAALVDVKKRISVVFGRPRLVIHGSKHLTAAFVLGRVFAPFELDIRQTPNELWRTDVPIRRTNPLVGNVTVNQSRRETGRLFIEVASRGKNVQEGVNAFVAERGVEPFVRLQLLPPRPTFNVDNSTCRSMVSQTYAEVETVMRQHQIKEIHLFAAVPQSFMIMLGREFKGMPPVQLYEWTGNEYLSSCHVSGSAL